MGRIFSWSVRRALHLITLVSLAPALAIIVWTALDHSRLLEETVRMDALRQTESVVRLQNQTINSVRYSLSTLAALPEFRNGDVKQQDTLLQLVLAYNPEFVNVAVTDADGMVVVSPRLAGGVSLADRLHVQRALATGRFSAGEFILARAGGDPSFPFAHPIRDASGEIIGCLTVAYRLSSYARLFRKWQLPEESVLHIVDRQGLHVFCRPNPGAELLGQSVAPDFWQELTNGPDSGTIRFEDDNGVVRLNAYRAMYLSGKPEPYAYVVLGIPERAATAPVRAVLIRNLALLALVILLASAIVEVLGGAVFARKFNLLTETAQSISHGNLSARANLPVDGSELDVLGAAIDHMAGQLETRAREQAIHHDQVERSLREKETLLKEIHHRVKNNLQLILSIVELQRGTEEARRQKTAGPEGINPEKTTGASGEAERFDSFCTTLENRVNAMAGVHQILYESPDLYTIDLGELLPRLVEAVTVALNVREVNVTAESVTARIEEATPIALITNELVVNACKYGSGPDHSPAVRVVLRRNGPDVELVVADSGPGLPPELTRADPSNLTTSKPSNAELQEPTPGPTYPGRRQARTVSTGESSGLGMSLVTSLAEQLGGTVSMANDNGAVVTIRFPLPATS